jgi:D-sedoheptulose 7-phosphate isomerase
MADVKSQAPKDHVAELFQRSAELKLRTAETQSEVIAEMAACVAECLRSGGKLLLCGNGGSAADAQHLAAELLVRLRPEVERQPLPALALTMDPSTLTASANDFSFDDHFARMTEVLGRPGDVLLGITTSGRSVNVIRALETAHRCGLRTIGFLGGPDRGQPAAAHCDIALIVESSETGRVQEVHETAGHAMLELVEEALMETPT